MTFGKGALDHPDRHPYSAQRRTLWMTLALVAVLGLLVGGPATHSSAIINGNTPAAAPSWVVNLLSYDGQQLHPACSGVLIAPNLILRAAHCPVMTRENPGVALIGRADSNPAGAGATQLVVATYKHSVEDLAVLQLGETVRLAPIQISPEDAAASPRQIPYTEVIRKLPS